MEIESTPFRTFLGLQKRRILIDQLRDRLEVKDLSRHR